MIAHTTLPVSDYTKSKAFYTTDGNNIEAVWYDSARES